MPIKAAWQDASAEAMSIASTSLQQRQSISLSSFFLLLDFGRSCPQWFCEKGVFKKSTKSTGASSGTVASCEFYKILKNTFFSQNTTSSCFWHFHQPRFLIPILYVINRQLRGECVQFLSMMEKGGAENFIFTFIFFRLITFFIQIQM